MYSVDPIRPNSSAPQLPKIIDLRGLHVPATEGTEIYFLTRWIRKQLVIYLAINILTLLDHLSQHSGQFQHDRCPTARVNGTMNPAVPVVPIEHIPVCGQKQRAAAEWPHAENRWNPQAGLDSISSLTWFNTPSDNSHHIGGVSQFCIVVDVHCHIAGREVQIQKYEQQGMETDKSPAGCIYSAEKV